MIKRELWLNHKDEEISEVNEDGLAKQPKLPIRKKMFWAIYSLILLLTLIVDTLVFVTYKYDIESLIAQFGNQSLGGSGMIFAR